MLKKLIDQLKNPRKLLKEYWAFFLYAAFGIFWRFWNFRNSLYFIYDQGRDAVALEKIAHGHISLVGPTTGLGGLYLGPLWYYVSLPGFLIVRGNPYGMCLWMMTIACIALPLYWYLAHRWFKKKFWAIIAAVLLAVIPGSLQASIFIWNPLLSVPLMLGVLLCFWKTRYPSEERWSRWWLGSGFFLLALTLQSEFAYAVFFMPVCFLAIPWIRQKKDWKDFVVAAGAVGVTLIPQALFEVLHRLIMTRSLLRSLADSSQSVSWSQLFAQRPQQLLDSTTELLFGPGNATPLLNLLFVALIVLGYFGLWKTFRQRATKKTDYQQKFLWQLTALFALIPYPFYLLWRGNHGYFFNYYITSHFIFLVPLVVLGLVQLFRFSGKNLLMKIVVAILVVSVLAVFGATSFRHWESSVGNPENNAGLAKMLAAVTRVYQWREEDKLDPWVVRIYTANVYTEQYDYLFGWYAQRYHLPTPITVRNGNETKWYVVVESRAHVIPVLFDPWYAAATKGGTKIREEQIGVLTLETWQKK